MPCVSSAGRSSVDDIVILFDMIQMLIVVCVDIAYCIACCVDVSRCVSCSLFAAVVFVCVQKATSTVRLLSVCYHTISW